MSGTTVVPPGESNPIPSGSSSQPDRALKPSRRGRPLLIVLLLVAATMLLYRPALHNRFVMYDDDVYVYQNARVLAGLSWQNVEWAFTATVADNWHPLTWLSHMTDVQLFGLNPMGHHLDSMLWHTLNVVLLFLLLAEATGYLWRSATVAAFFAFCPLNVQCVAWVAERKSLISTTFLLLALFAYGWYVRRPSAGRYLAVAFLFALGLMAKPMIVTLPVLLLLADYWPLQRLGPAGKGFGRLVAEKIPLFVLSAASSIVTIYAQKKGGALTSTAMIPLQSRIANAIYSYMLYIVKMLWPTHLAFFHPYPSVELWVVAVAAVTLGAITIMAWRYRDNGALAVGWAWYLVTLTPVVGLIQVADQGWAERYAYVPFIGLFVAIVWTVSEAAERFRWTRWAAGSAAVVGLLAYAGVSHVQIGYWRNSYSLFSHAVAVTSRNAVAETNLGAVYYDSGQLDEAERHYRAAVAYRPDLRATRQDLDQVLLREGRIEEALDNDLAFCNNQLRYDPNDAGCLRARGTLELRRNQLDAALADLTRTVEILPSAKAYSTLGEAYERKGNVEAAVQCYRKALQIDPNFAQASSRLAALTH